jgi:MFS superfamily sulfate permease-like transporter
VDLSTSANQTSTLLLSLLLRRSCQLLLSFCYSSTLRFQNVRNFCIVYVWEPNSFLAFGRVNGYKINPNQELIAIGVTNTVGSCFGAYPATGSFSRSALKSKSGVRTPLAGVFSAVVIIVALYGLTPAFYWIPQAGLSAVIIHAVADLVASPSQVSGHSLDAESHL